MADIADDGFVTGLLGSWQASDRAEKYTLCALLREPADLAEVAGFLRPESFRQHGHQTLYRTMLGLWNQSTPVDPASVADVLHRQGQLADLGEGNDAYVYLETLWKLPAAPGSAASHAREVRSYAILRQLEMVAAGILHDARNPTGPAEQVLEAAERALFAVGELGAEGNSVPLSEAVDAALEAIDRRTVDRFERGSYPGVPSGIGPLDELTSGWRQGELIVLAARPSVGKTAFSLFLARSAAEKASVVLYQSLEQTGPELAERLLCAESGVRAEACRRGLVNADEAGLLNAASQILHPLPLWVDDSPRQSLLRIAANARRFRSRGKLDLLIIDYLQLLEPEDRKAKRHEQVGEISRGLKCLARELCIPVIALAQLNREVENRASNKPRLADLRDSGNIEQDADTVILLHRPPELLHALDLLIAKQRNGPTGEVQVYFDRSRMRFEANSPSSGSAYDPFGDS